tara:strand:+ start:605 stop:1225 length:621 start_codon:yes stop_codon:yes gene_type:complete
LKLGKISHPKDSENYKSNNFYVRTVVGTFLLNDKTYMDTDFNQHPNRYTFSKRITNANENFNFRKKITKKEQLFATQVMTGQPAIDAVKNVYGTKDFQKAKTKAVLLLKQERVMSEIEKGVNDIAKSMGISHEYVLGRLKMLADSSPDDNVVLQSAKELGKIIGTSTNIKKDNAAVGFFSGFSQDQLEGVSREQNKLSGEIDNEMP